MNANKTKIFPPTVKIINTPRHIAIKIICHNSKGGKTGPMELSVGVLSFL